MISSYSLEWARVYVRTWAAGEVSRETLICTLLSTRPGPNRGVADPQYSSSHRLRGKLRRLLSVGAHQDEGKEQAGTWELRPSPVMPTV